MKVNFDNNSLQESEAAHERFSLKWAKLRFYVSGKQPIEPMKELIFSNFRAFSLQLYLKMNSSKAIFKDFD